MLAEGGIPVLMSHLGRPGGERVSKMSLSALVGEVENAVGATVHFAEDCIGQMAEAVVAKAKPGEAVLLENLRYYKEETSGDEYNLYIYSINYGKT